MGSESLLWLLLAVLTSVNRLFSHFFDVIDWIIHPPTHGPLLSISIVWRSQQRQEKRLSDGGPSWFASVGGGAYQPIIKSRRISDEDTVGTEQANQLGHLTLTTQKNRNVATNTLFWDSGTGTCINDSSKLFVKIVPLTTHCVVAQPCCCQWIAVGFQSVSWPTYGDRSVRTGRLGTPNIYKNIYIYILYYIILYYIYIILYILYILYIYIYYILYILYIYILYILYIIYIISNYRILVALQQPQEREKLGSY